MKTLAMIKYTLYEYLHGIGFMILLFVFGMIFIVFGIGLSVEETITGEQVTFFGQKLFGDGRMLPPEMGEVARAGAASLIQFIFAMNAAVIWGPMFFILISSRAIESMLTQGNRALLLSKPMYRWHIFLARMAGFMLFSAIVVYLFLGGLWLIIGIKTGCFIYQPFVAAPIILLIYLSLLSMIALVTLLIENFFAAAGITVIFYFITTVLSVMGEFLEENTTLHLGWTIIHGALPRIGELSSALYSLYGEHPAELVTPIWATLLFCAVMIGITAFIFTRKDY